MKSGKNTLIVLCAGLGRRMGKNIPKMLIPLSGRPLLYWSLKNLERCTAVGALVLVVPRGSKNLFEKKLKNFGFKKVAAVVEGGRMRSDSTRAALRALPRDCAWVGIHDGARIFAPPDLVARCYRVARKTGAAILAVPAKDTVKLADAKRMIQTTLPRTQCWAAQTPQVFRRDVAEKIHGENWAARFRNFTDDASMAESLNYKVRIVPSSYENMKITTPEDLVLAQAFLRRKRGTRA